MLLGYRYNIAFQFIHEYLGPRKTLALQEFHSITGRAKKVNQRSWENQFQVVYGVIWPHYWIPSNPRRLWLSIWKINSDCQTILCMLTSTKFISANETATLRWKKFKHLKYSYVQWIIMLCYVLIPWFGEHR